MKTLQFNGSVGLSCLPLGNSFMKNSIALVKEPCVRWLSFEGIFRGVILFLRRYLHIKEIGCNCLLSSLWEYFVDITFILFIFILSK